MGTCASSHLTARQDGSINFPSAKVVHLDGRLQEFRRRITAAELLFLHPNCFLCSSDTMTISSYPPQLPADYVLQFGQIYFLMPVTKSLSPLSLQDLCALAIKASTSLAITNSGPFANENKRVVKFLAGNCKDIATF